MVATDVLGGKQTVWPVRSSVSVVTVSTVGDRAKFLKELSYFVDKFSEFYLPDSGICGSHHPNVIGIEHSDIN